VRNESESPLCLLLHTVNGPVVRTNHLQAGRTSTPWNVAHANTSTPGCARERAGAAPWRQCRGSRPSTPGTSRSLLCRCQCRRTSTPPAPCAQQPQTQACQTQVATGPARCVRLGCPVTQVREPISLRREECPPRCAARGGTGAGQGQDAHLGGVDVEGEGRAPGCAQQQCQHYHVRHSLHASDGRQIYLFCVVKRDKAS